MLVLYVWMLDLLQKNTTSECQNLPRHSAGKKSKKKLARENMATFVSLECSEPKNNGRMINRQAASYCIDHHANSFPVLPAGYCCSGQAATESFSLAISVGIWRYLYKCTQLPVQSLPVARVILEIVTFYMPNAGINFCSILACSVPT